LRPHDEFYLNEKLEEMEMDRNPEAGPSAAPSAVHGAFSIERDFVAVPSRVFNAFADPTTKARWFGSESPHMVLERFMDVRPGGRERLKVQWAGGLTTTFDATYFDVVADARLVYTYEMQMDGKKISVSLATLEFSAEAEGTRLKLTEQGVFLDGYEDAGSREKGTSHLLERLSQSLAEQSLEE